MGNSKDGTGYGCSLPAMINSWRKAWTGGSSGENDDGDDAVAAEESQQRLFGVATLAAGGSEGNGIHMAGMRWSQTANFGAFPYNP